MEKRAGKLDEKRILLKNIIYFTFRMNTLDSARFLNLMQLEFLVPFFPSFDASLSSTFWDTLTSREKFYLAEWRQHRLTPMLYELIFIRGLQREFSHWLLQALKNDYAATMQRAVQEEEEILEILRALQQAKLEVILLKGVDLRHRIYRDLPVRVMSDMDLMIPRDCLDRVCAILVGLGYSPEPSMKGFYHRLRRRFSYYIGFNPPSGKVLYIDLHWEIQTTYSLTRLCHKDLSQTSLPADYDGVSVRNLSPEHLLLHLCLHTLEHNFAYNEANSDIGQKLIDIVWVVERLSIDWNKFLAETRKFHCSLSVGLVLRDIATLLPNITPAWVLSSLQCNISWDESIIWQLQRGIRYLFPEFLRIKWQLAGIFLAFILSRIRLIRYRLSPCAINVV